MSDRLFAAWTVGPAQRALALGLQLAVGLLLSTAVAWVGYRRRSLSRTGLYGAIVVGTLIFGLGGWPWGLLLIAFFATSSALSHYRSDRKQAVADYFAKTGCRDLGQVLANGGLGVLLAAWFALTGGRSVLLFFAFTGAMAAVTADTWATELGVLSREKPHLITSGDTVEPGTSGAISWLGAISSVVGAWLIGFLGLAFQSIQSWLGGGPRGVPLGWLPLAAALAGLAGSLFDSLLGATLQATYYCPRCGKETEQPMHRCGRQPIYVRGWHWLDNDWVNLLASLVGTLVATGLGVLALSLR